LVNGIALLQNLICELHGSQGLFFLPFTVGWQGRWQVGSRVSKGGSIRVARSPPSNFTRLEMLAKVSQNPTLGHGLDTFWSVFLCPKFSQKLELIDCPNWPSISPSLDFAR